MSEIINLEDEFSSWLDTLGDDVIYAHDFDRVFVLLKAAYLHGIKTAARDSVDTLMDYSTSLADIDAYTYNPDEAYAACAVSLDVYWQDVLKDKECKFLS